MRATQLCRHLEMQEMQIDCDGHSVEAEDTQLKRAQGVDSQLHDPNCSSACWCHCSEFNCCHELKGRGKEGKGEGEGEGEGHDRVHRDRNECCCFDC
jgi:hypothetical protein